MKDTIPQNVLNLALTESFIRVWSFLFLEVLLKHLSMLSLTFSVFSASLSSTNISVSRLINRANRATVYRSLSASYATALTTWQITLRLCDRADHMTKYPELSAARGKEIETSMYDKMFYYPTELGRVQITPKTSTKFHAVFVLQKNRLDRFSRNAHATMFSKSADERKPF